jgi:hypothetical protein
MDQYELFGRFVLLCVKLKRISIPAPFIPAASQLMEV